MFRLRAVFLRRFFLLVDLYGLSFGWFYHHFDNLLPSSTITFPKTLTRQRQHRDFQSGMLLSFCRPQEVECLAALHSTVETGSMVMVCFFPLRASLFCLS
jgi:hypothetical protein